MFKKIHSLRFSDYLNNPGVDIDSLRKIFCTESPRDYFRCDREIHGAMGTGGQAMEDGETPNFYVYPINGHY